MIGERRVNRFLCNVCAGFVALLLAFGAHGARTTEFVVYASPLGEYMTKVGPSLEESAGLMLEIAASAFKPSDLLARMAPQMPWARAQAEAKEIPGAILFGLARTPQRESQWQWLSPVYTDKIYAFTLAGRPAYSSFEDIRRQKPKVGTKLGSASESILKGMGMSVDASPDMERNFMKLFSGRVDVILLQGMYVDSAIQTMLSSRYGDEFSPRVRDLRRVAIMEVPLWMVTSRKTPDADAQRLRGAIGRFKKTADYREIIRKYEARLSGLAH